MGDIQDVSVGPLKFDTLSENLAKADKNLSKINLNTANVAEKAFTSLDKRYRLYLGKRLDATQIKIANQWMESAKAEVEGLKPDQVLLQATQKTLQDASTSLQAKITRNQGRWESPGLVRKFFYNVKQEKEASLQKLQSKTKTLTKQITNFNREVTKFNKTASDTATKITASWKGCQGQIQLYGQARDTLVATSQLLKSTSSKLSDYDPATQKALSPKLDQLQALQERLAQVKAKRTDRGLDLSQDKVFNKEKKEMERLSEMLTTLTKEIQTILDTSPKLTKMEKITHYFKSVSSPRSTVPAEKEALLSALKEPKKEAIPDSAAAKGKASILGRGSSAQAKSPSDVIQKTVENSPQAVVAALQVLIARCEVEPTNTTSKKELMTLLDAIQTHKQIPAVFKGRPSLRDRIAAAKLYKLQDTDKAFLQDKTTLKEKLSHIENNIKLWQCEPELIKLAQTKSEATTKALAALPIPTLSETTTKQLSLIADEIQSTEKSFLKSLQNYRNAAQKLAEDPTTPENMKIICRNVIQQIGKEPTSFVDQSPLLANTDGLTGIALLKKLLENRSSSAMKKQIDTLHLLSQTSFQNDAAKIDEYLNDKYTPSIFKKDDVALMGAAQYLNQNKIDAPSMFSLAITGVQRLPRYPLLLDTLAKKLDLQKIISKNKEELHTKTTKLSNLEKSTTTQKENIDKLEKEIKDLEKEIKDLEKEINDLEKDLKENLTQINDLRKHTEPCLEIAAFDTALVNLKQE